jgi:hypothetical protein
MREERPHAQLADKTIAKDMHGVHREARLKPKQATTGQPSGRWEPDELSGCVTGAGRLSRLSRQARNRLHSRVYHAVLVSPGHSRRELQEGRVDGILL